MKMSNNKQIKENLEKLQDLKQQLMTAKNILKEAGAAMPSKKFFDAKLNAFETKLGDLLSGVLTKHDVKPDLIKDITNDFLKEFNKHVLAMTPFSRNQKSKGKK